jgi:precorrin-6A/cobalt-precorrin-6A reductase
VLILGGTGEARALAAALHDRPGFSVTSSLAGRVRDPALPVGAVLIGGFGGTAGLVAFLLEHRFDAVLDATHPFARTMTEHAVAATAEARVPLLIVRRPGWVERDGDRWHRVESVAAAADKARKLTTPGATVFVTTGRRELAPFAVDAERHYLIRTVDEPADALPARHTVIRDRGPYTIGGELDLMRRHDVRVLVTKDSGGAMTTAKIDAARTLRLPVVMVDRPALPTSDLVEVTTVADAVAWCGG